MAYCMTYASFEEPAHIYSTASNTTTEAKTSSISFTKDDSDSSLRSRRSHRRRHSSYHTQNLWSFEHDNIQLLLDRFLSELGRRLDFLEAYGQLPIQLDIDSGIDRAYSTLQTVRDSCNHVSDEVIGAGRRRAKILVDTLEESYKGTLARKETMESKVQEAVKVMDAILQDFEARAYAVRDSTAGAAGELFGRGMMRMDSGFERAREVVGEGFEKAKRAKDSLRAKIETALLSAKERGLITFDDLPDPWRTNPHIRRGYRFCETKLDCVRSIIGVSNEMFNIWSHLIGFVVVLALAFYIYPSSPNFSQATTADIIVAGVFFMAACECLACSTIWHTMSSISNVSLMERFACVDYTGIALLVATSILTTEYTAFYCEPVPRWIYMSMTAVLGICGTILPWHPTFNRNDMSWARVLFFVSLAATGAVPMLQLSLTRGFGWMAYFYLPITKSLVVYLTGAFLYMMKIPERWWPGAFDFVGGSHNIWHVAVLGGILFHYTAMQEFFRQAFERSGADCPPY